MLENETVASFSVLNDAWQMFASGYQMTLPTAEELQHEIERERKLTEVARND